MKWNKVWKALSRDQKAAWKTWAKNNRLRLENGDWRFLSAPKAFAVVTANRMRAWEIADPGVPPVAPHWHLNALSLDNAGPFTAGAGTMSFRAALDIASPAKWFVWATPPLPGTESDPLRWLRFVNCLAVGTIASGALTDNFAPDYRAVLGSFNGPGVEGAWPEDHFVWFEVHQYRNGQLGPGLMLRGQVQVEL